MVKVINSAHFLHQNIIPKDKALSRLILFLCKEQNKK